MDLLTTVYSLTGVVVGAAFVPQVVALLRDPQARIWINTPAWVMFSACSIVTLAYACVQNGDAYFIFCSAVGVAGNLSVLALSLLPEHRGGCCSGATARPARRQRGRGLGRRAAERTLP